MVFRSAVEDAEQFLTLFSVLNTISLVFLFAEMLRSGFLSAISEFASGGLGLSEARIVDQTLMNDFLQRLIAIGYVPDHKN